MDEDSSCRYGRFQHRGLIVITGSEVIIPDYGISFGNL